VTGRADLDRALSAYFDARRTSRPPDGLSDAVRARVATTRQRPALLTRERWRPAAPAGRSVPAARTILLIAIVALLVVVSIVVSFAVGSRQRLPPPFGPARSGLVAFDRGGDVYLIHPDGTGSRQLTSGPDVDSGAVWSPDGTRLAFLSETDVTTSLVVVGSDGGGRVTVAHDLAVVLGMDWSPDSSRLVFGGRFEGDHLVHLFVGDAEAGSSVRLGGSDLYADWPSWSPDGRRIAFKRIDPAADDALRATGDLWLMNADGTDAHRLTSLGGGQNALVNTAWSPDGRSIAFLATTDAQYDVYVTGPDEGEPRNISHSVANEFWPSWSPDGTRIAFARLEPGAGNQGVIVVADPDGSHPVTLVGPPVNSNTPVWSPDGTRLLADAKNPDPGQDVNAAIAVFDPTGRVPTTMISAPNFLSASWQRLAP
jgi:TolB protein